jgi:hypothetical protein
MIDKVVALVKVTSKSSAAAVVVYLAAWVMKIPTESAPTSGIFPVWPMELVLRDSVLKYLLITLLTITLLTLIATLVLALL